MDMLSIVTYPNSVLDRPAEEVKFPLDKETQKLIADMWQTVDKAEGAGLAAPQVGVSKQICLINLAETEKGSGAKNITMINPKIIFLSQVENLMVEGCLSFPGEYYEIWRPANLIVEYFDPKGKKHKLRAKDWLARVIQHEVFHLQGKLFINMGGRKLKPEELEDRKVVD